MPCNAPVRPNALTSYVTFVTNFKRSLGLKELLNDPQRY